MHLELLSSTNPVAILPIVEMATFLRVDDPTQLTELGLLIKAATTKFQEHTGRQAFTATYKMTLQGFPSCSRSIRIPRPPTVTIDTVGYYATAGVLTTTTDYQLVKDEIFSYLVPAANGHWPNTAEGVANAVEITFTCGYGSTRDDIEEDLIHSLKVLVGHWFENREAGDVPEFILNLWGSYGAEVHD